MLQSQNPYWGRYIPPSAAGAAVDAGAPLPAAAGAGLALPAPAPPPAALPPCQLAPMMCGREPPPPPAAAVGASPDTLGCKPLLGPSMLTWGAAPLSDPLLNTPPGGSEDPRTLAVGDVGLDAAVGVVAAAVVAADADPPPVAAASSVLTAGGFKPLPSLPAAPPLPPDAGFSASEVSSVAAFMAAGSVVSPVPPGGTAPGAAAPSLLRTTPRAPAPLPLPPSSPSSSESCPGLTLRASQTRTCTILRALTSCPAFHLHCSGQFLDRSLQAPCCHMRQCTVLTARTQKTAPHRRASLCACPPPRTSMSSSGNSLTAVGAGW
jgi:hypothetical protein